MCVSSVVSVYGLDATVGAVWLPIQTNRRMLPVHVTALQPNYSLPSQYPELQEVQFHYTARTFRQHLCTLLFTQLWRGNCAIARFLISMPCSLTRDDLHQEMGLVLKQIRAEVHVCCLTLYLLLYMCITSSLRHCFLEEAVVSTSCVKCCNTNILTHTNIRMHTNTHKATFSAHCTSLYILTLECAKSLIDT